MLLNELRSAGFFDVFEVVARRTDGAALPPTQVGSSKRQTKLYPATYLILNLLCKIVGKRYIIIIVIT